MTQLANIPLIPRGGFFENPAALNPRLSPDASWLFWLAPFDGVMNLWVAPCDDLAKARALTRQTARPIFVEHWFARTNAHVLFRKDKDDDENFHLWCSLRCFTRPPTWTSMFVVARIER